MQKAKAYKAPQRFIQKAGVNRALDNQARAVADHAPGQIGRSAESLLIHIVAPTAYGLSNQKAEGRQIENGGDFQAAQLCHQRAAEQPADDPAVNAKTAVPNIQNAERILHVLVAGIKDNVVQSGADDSADHTDDHGVDQLVLVNVELFAAEHQIQKGQ